MSYTTYSDAMAKKIDPASAPIRVGAAYPPPYDAPCAKRHRVRLGAAAGLTRLGVNRCTLPPGTWSSQRHAHTHEDEFVYVLEGEVVLVSNDGEETFRAGDAVGFPANNGDAHQIQNRSDRDAVLLEIGTSSTEDDIDYPDIDLRSVHDEYVHRDGTPY